VLIRKRSNVERRKNTETVQEPNRAVVCLKSTFSLTKKKRKHKGRKQKIDIQIRPTQTFCLITNKTKNKNAKQVLFGTKLGSCLFSLFDEHQLFFCFFPFRIETKT